MYICIIVYAYSSRVCRQQNSVRIVQTCILFNKLYTLSVRTQLANGNVENACWLCMFCSFVDHPHAHPPAQNTQEQGVTKVSMLSHEEYIAKQIYSKHVRGSAHAHNAQLSNQKTFSRFFVCDGVDPAAGPGYIYALREHRARGCDIQIYALRLIPCNRLVRARESRINWFGGAETDKDISNLVYICIYRFWYLFQSGLRRRIHTIYENTLFIK